MSHQLSFNTSSFVDDLIPEHVATNYPDLIEFIKVYALFLERENTSTFYLNQLDQQRDIDLIEEELLNELQNEIGVAVPRTFASDPRLFYKHLIEFYRSRGTPDAIKTFFRLIHDEGVEVYFPKDDILAPSDATWSNVSESVMQNHLDFSHGGKCSDPEFTTQNSCETSYCTIPNHPLQNECEDNGGTWIEGSLWTEVNLLSYSPIQTWEITSPTDTVSQADTNGELPIGDGLYFKNGVFVEVTEYVSAQDFSISLKFNEDLEVGDIITAYRRGNFANDDGKPSVLKYLQDSYFYQKFSYVLKTGVDKSVWGDSFKRLAHPAGFIFFGEIYVFVTILTKGMPHSQPGSQQGGLPFNIFIPWMPYGPSISTHTFKAYKSYSYDDDVRARIGAYDHFENTKFWNWRPIRDYREFTIQDVINKDINIHFGAKVAIDEQPLIP